MRVAVPKESRLGERRVAATPDTVGRLIKLGFEVSIERGAGDEAGYKDAGYVEAGATMLDDVYPTGDVLVKVNPPIPEEVARLKDGALLISMLYPAQNQPLVQLLADRKVSAIALDRIPRISRAQKMDVLSSMGNIAGYRAVIEAANQLPRFFGGQITAAGKTPPARVLVIGAGVAGLAAIGAARGLGAEVYAFDTRKAAREQVESMGGKFLTVELEEAGEGAGGYAKEMSQAFIDAEMALFLDQAPKTDIVITTALIPGRRAPILWNKASVEAMKPGSVVVDLAASQGGNCEATVPGELVKHGDVTIVGYTDLTSRLPGHASQFFARNVVHLLEDMGGGTGFKIDQGDEVVRGALIVAQGAILPPPPPPEPSPPPAQKPAAAAAPPVVAKKQLPASKPGHGHGGGIEPMSSTALGSVGVVAAIGLAALSQLAPAEFIQHFTVFVLAVLIGWQVIWNVSPALHTPLMSVTNAISGIILVGGMLQAGTGNFGVAAILGAVAILLAAINVFGGFLVTQRMLQMFREVIVNNLLTVAYLAAAVLFILSLGGLSNQTSARRGNLFGIVGMTIAFAASFLHDRIGGTGYAAILVPVAIGGAVGALLAARVAMTSMPELVALLHSFVGMAAVLVGISTFLDPGKELVGAARIVHDVEIFLDVGIGAITFTGSMVAWAKLSGRLSGKPLLLPARHALNLAGALITVGLIVPFTNEVAPGGLVWLLAMTTVTGLLGIHLVAGIGGADMPVVVSLLNSYSGWTAAAAGFMLENDLLIVTGALVGSSGAILSYIMCKAMNRSIWNVVFGGFGSDSGKPSTAAAVSGEVKPVDLDGMVALCEAAKSVVVVPGYGMAVAQAQHAVREFAELLRANGCEVRFAIHPVAGRLPGHMNVLLAEAGVPYDIVLEMDEINPDFPRTDLVLVIGANDIVNPGAQTDPGSPIYGMPVLEAWKAATCVVVKRGMAAGYAGVDNPLFVHEHTRMLFGDAKDMMQKLVGQLKQLRAA